MSVIATATGGGYYRVLVDGVEVSQHVAEREALEKCGEILDLAWDSGAPEPDVRYVHDYEVRTVLRKPWPGPMPAPIVPPPVPDVTPPNTPAGLNPVVISASQIDVSWNAATDPAGAPGETVSGVVNYRLYRDSSPIALTPNLTYSDTGLNEYQQYSYQIVSVDGYGNESDLSAAVAVTTLDSTAPSAPVITASANGQTAIDVALTTPSTDAHSGVASYELEYKTRASGTWSVWDATALAGEFPITITGLVANTTYDTRARATDNSGNVGSYSATSSANTKFSITPIQFTFGTSSQHSLSTYYSAGIPGGESVTNLQITSGTLPSGVTLNVGNQSLDYNGSGAVTSVSGLVLEVTTA